MNKNYPEQFYNSWQNMKKRCNDPNADNYEYYGGRGISYDKNWESIEGFYEDMFTSWEMGLTLDRVDVNGDYSKNNCRWITQKEQCYNRRSNRLITINNTTKTLVEWSRESGVPESTIWCRIDRGLIGEELIEPNPRPISKKQSGVQGVIWNKKEEKWVVNAVIEGKKKRLGSFNEEDLNKAIQLKNDYEEGKEVSYS